MKTIRDMFLDKKRNRMLKKNQNLIMTVVGQTGSGKTYAALTLADELMYGKLDPYKNIVFSIKEFMELVNSKTLKAGDVVVFEEAGVNISSKNWFSNANRNINFVLQTCRHLNFGIIFTLPAFKFMDNSSRILVHTSMETSRIDYDKNISVLKVYDFIMRPHFSSEPLKMFPRFWFDDSIIAMKYIHVKLPRKEILDIYERRKKEFTSALNKKVLDSITFEEREEQEKIKKPSCKICGAHRFDYSKTRHDWTCKTCGNVLKDSPYKEFEGYVSEKGRFRR